MDSDDQGNAPTNASAPQSNPALSRLAAFVGEWRREATVSGQPTGQGRSVFDWLEGGACIIERSEGNQANFPSSTAIIGCDDDSGAHCMFQYDSRGIARIYQMSLSNGVWKQWRDAPGFFQRLTGTFSDDGNTIVGAWEQSSNGIT
jgi:hypothetical protein